MSEQRILGEVRNLADYHAIARARANELELTREGLDRLAGFAHGHAAKMLAQFPLKRIGPQSFDILNGALGMKLVAVEDAETLKAHANLRAANQRLRLGRGEHDMLTMADLRARILRRLGQKACRARNAKLSPEARSRIAREAALARAAKLSPEARSRISREAAQARWERLDAAGRKEAMRPLAKGYRAYVAHRRKRARAYS